MSVIHSHRCDYDTSGECYCPMPGEETLRCGHLPEAGCECADFENEGRERHFCDTCGIFH